MSVSGYVFSLLDLDFLWLIERLSVTSFLFVLVFCANNLLIFVMHHRLMDIAKEMTREGLPIKCLEAVILAMYL